VLELSLKILFQNTCKMSSECELVAVIVVVRNMLAGFQNSLDDFCFLNVYFCFVC